MYDINCVCICVWGVHASRGQEQMSCAPLYSFVPYAPWQFLLWKQSSVFSWAGRTASPQDPLFLAPCWCYRCTQDCARCTWLLDSVLGSPCLSSKWAISQILLFSWYFSLQSVKMPVCLHYPNISSNINQETSESGFWGFLSFNQLLGLLSFITCLCDLHNIKTSGY